MYCFVVFPFLSPSVCIELVKIVKTLPHIFKKRQKTMDYTGLIINDEMEYVRTLLSAYLCCTLENQL